MELTKYEKLMKNVALAYAVIFVVAVLVFIFLPGVLLDLINSLSRFVMPSLPLATDDGKFWLSMTVSMMATITALCLFIYRDVRQYATMALPLVVAKYTSSLFGIGFFLIGMIFTETRWNTLANLIIFISDFPLGTLMLILYKKLQQEKAAS